MDLMSDDLPAPLSPTRAVTWPRDIEVDVVEGLDGPEALGHPPQLEEGPPVLRRRCRRRFHVPAYRILARRTIRRGRRGGSRRYQPGTPGGTPTG